MTSHATLTYKRSFHFTALYCSFDTTHSDCSHCITPQACARALHTLLSHPGSLCTDSLIHMEGKARLSHLSQDTKQASTPTAQLHPHAPKHQTKLRACSPSPQTTPQAGRKLSQHQGCPHQTLFEQGSIRGSSPDSSLGSSMY